MYENSKKVLVLVEKTSDFFIYTALFKFDRLLVPYLYLNLRCDVALFRKISNMAICQISYLLNNSCSCEIGFRDAIIAENVTSKGSARIERENFFYSEFFIKKFINH